ncbi:Uncharacterized protein dnl_55760 [Desulfonema limicola]|uniref:SHOCT domain-containing protein n=1 Tax=Desulfonema limicola TaxID=45656 RepID=A0A975BDC2_9BACT|nr:SHOCT domain-containing protein [Desulfonema limicola]QTA83180.1 Uncharacterized protein dnl_55760 [Desulfonema limicola]
MKKWFQDKIKSDYMQRQIYMMTNLGLFYIIIIALFAVPLMGTFVVVLIKGVLDFRYLILAGGIIFTALIIFYGARFIIKAFKRFKKNGIDAFQDAQNQGKTGEPVQIGMFNGLITFSYGRNNNDKNLVQNQDTVLLLPDASSKSAAYDAMQKIKELSEMKNQGIISEDEFQLLKQNLIHEI